MRDLAEVRYQRVSALTVLGAAFLLFCVPSRSLAQTGDNPADLRLVLTAAKPNIMLGEPVQGTVKVVNNSSVKRRIYPFLELRQGFLVYDVQGPGGESVIGPFAVPSRRPPEKDPAMDLAPGAALVHDDILAYSGGSPGPGWAFNTVGDYQIQATFGGARDTNGASLKSNLLRITVGPVKAGEEQALKLVASREGALLFTGDSLSDKIVRDFHELLAKYPSSAYAPFCRFGLGVHYARSLQHAEALKMLEHMADSPTCPGRVEIQYRLGLAQMAIGHEDEGRTRLRRLIADSSQHRVALWAAEALDASGKDGLYSH